MRCLGLFLFLAFAPSMNAQTPDVAVGKAKPVATHKTAASNKAETPQTQQPVPPSVFADRPNVNPDIGEDALSYKDAFLAFLKTILMLLVVLAFAYLLLGKGLPKLMSKTIHGSRMRIIERLPLDQKRSVFLVEVDSTTYLLGGSDQNLQLIDTLKKETPDFQSKLDVKKEAASTLKEVS